MSKPWLLFVLLLLLPFLALQATRPTLSNPPVTAELQVPPEVKQILRNACSIDPRNATMSTLYETTLVTWKQIPDEHWFGAKIAGPRASPMP
jgi:hypothetical protein